MSKYNDLKPIVKNRYRRYHRSSFEEKLMKGAIAFLAGLTIGVPFLSYFNIGKVDLPDKTEIQENVDKLNVDTTIISKAGSHTYSRLYKNQLSGPIKVGYSKDLTPDEVQAIKESLNVYNYVFSVINPAYKFVLDDDTSTLDHLNPHYIYVDTAEQAHPYDPGAIAVQKGGQLPNSQGVSNVNNTIVMGRDSRDNVRMFKATFLHEFMHVLGVDDAYNKSGYYEQTIMNATAQDTRTNNIYKHDVKLLAALYADLDDQETYEKVMNFIDSYGHGSSYTDTSWYKSN